MRWWQRSPAARKYVSEDEQGDKELSHLEADEHCVVAQFFELVLDPRKNLAHPSDTHQLPDPKNTYLGSNPELT